MREIIQDIKKPRRSLREVLPKETPNIKRVNRSVSEDLVSSSPESDELSRPPQMRPASSHRLWWLIVAVILLVGGGLFLISTVFSQATVNINLREEAFPLDETLIATKSQTDAGLGFEVMTLESSEGQLVKTTGTEKVAKKATGKILIYNNYNTASQSLVKSTRFEAKNGKIYRTTEVVTVPGLKKQGEETVPGSVEATIVADQPGAEYNSDPTDFTIPGFKAGPRYNKFYARSQAPLTGGLVGEINKISTEDQNLAKEKLEASLKEKLLAEAKTKTPVGFIFYPDGVFWTFVESVPVGNSGQEVEFKETASLNAILLKQDNVSHELAKLKLSDLGENPISINNIDQLIFQIIEKEKFDPTKDTSLKIKLSGEAKATWLLKEEELKSNLSGLAKDGYQSVFSQYPAIKRAEVIFRPPWIRKFPTDLEKIKIVIKPEA